MDKSCHWLWVGVTLLLLQCVSSYLTVTDDALCGMGMLQLRPLGGDSAALVKMQPRPWREEYCSYAVLVSPGRMLAIRPVPADRRPKDSAPGRRRPADCLLQVRYPHTLQPLEEIDLCNSSSLSRTLLLENPHFPYATVITRRVSKHAAKYLEAGAVLFTSVAKGDACSHPGMVSCMDHGGSPLLCVPTDLACDGYANCPAGSKDEEKEACRQKDKLTTEDPSKQDIQDIYLIDGPPSHSGGSGDSLAKALAHYGPWGYLMLGTLLCGALLMVCGLWECCCRGKATRRRSPLVPSHTPTVYIIGPADASAPPTTPGPGASAPPTYEDLDQPPNYTALFPNEKDAPKKTQAPASSC